MTGYPRGVLVGVVVTLFAASAGSAEGTDRQEQKGNGKAAYAKAGCEACHGPEGNGKSQGPPLVPFTLELPELITIVRQGIGVMPGTPRDRVSDAEIAAIRVYLMSLETELETPPTP
jgi:mono/diheme cytochrome c family protein